MAAKSDENPGYREYLNTTVREFLEEEHRCAEDAHGAYLRELGRIGKEVGLDEETAALRLRDEDLWMLYPDQRFDEELQGAEGVRLWEETVIAAQTMADGVSNGPGSIQMSPTITQLVWDAAARAEEALRRARERS